MMRTLMRKSGMFLALVVPFCLMSCMGKSGMGNGVPGSINGEYLLFLSAVQGNPLGMFVSIQKMRIPGKIRSPSTKWQVHAWGLTPGASPCLFTQKGKDKQDPEAPLSWKNDTLLFTTDKDRFVFYKPLKLDKLLLLTDSIFPDRVRRSREEEIRYGLIPSVLYWNNEKIEGKLFYEQRDLSESASPAGFLPLTGLKPNGRVYVLWAPDGVFLRIEKQEDEQGRYLSRVALMQDRRGRWEETYDVNMEEPACAFSSTSCSGPAGVFRLQIPLWRLSGQLESLQGVRMGMEAQAQKVNTEEKALSGGQLLWTTLEALPDGKGKPQVDFCLLKGTLEINRETKAVYGIGMTAKGS